MATARRVLFSVDDPRKASFFQTDCISCHTTGAAERRFLTGAALDAAALDPNRFRSPSGITGFPLAEALPFFVDVWDIRSFGYFGSFPTVAPRTVTEAAAVADLTNRITASRNPGIERTLDEERAAWKCMFAGGTESQCLGAGFE
jgi:hypothetical protein